MKKLFTKLCLLGVLCLIGGNAWAETSVLYERGTKSENAWTAENLSDFTASWAELAVDNTYGATFRNTNNGSFKATKSINASEGSIINIDAYVELYSNTSAGFSQCAYFRFGNIYIGQNDQDKISRYSLNGMPTGSSTSFNHGTYRGGSSPIYHIQIEVNTATNTLNQLVVSNEDGSVKWVNITEATALTNASYSDVEFGFNKTTRTTTEKIVGLKSIKISQTTQDVQSANYTINYIFNNETIKTVEGKNTVGLTINAESPITIEGQKYYFADGAKTSMTIDEDAANNVLDVELRKAYEYNYSVVSSTGKQLASGTRTEGENVTVAVPRYINVSGTLYETSKGGDWYHRTYTITQDNQTETVAYTETSYKNVVFYAEAEELPGATSGNGNGSRTSMGLTGYGTNLPVTNLAAGSYKIYMHAANGNSAARAVAFKNGEDAVAEFTIIGSRNDQDFTSDEFTLNQAANITLTSEGSQASGVDYFFIVKTAETVSVPATVGMATFCSHYNLDFTNTTIKAYTGVVDGNAVKLTEATIVKAGEGVLLVAEGDATENIPVVTEAEALTGNQFVGVLTETTVGKAETGTNYVLAYNSASVSETIGFYSINGTSATVAAGKAYLYDPELVGASTRLTLDFGDVTGINAVETAKTVENGATFNLSGQRVSDSYKGVVIKNGVKYFNK